MMKISVEDFRDKQTIESNIKKLLAKYNIDSLDLLELNQYVVDKIDETAENIYWETINLDE